MKRNKKEYTIDIKSWLFKFRSKWYLFLACALVSLAAAYVYVKASPRIYAFSSTFLLGDQQTGSKKAQELLEVLQVQNKGIKVEDEIGLLQSDEMVKQALRKLDFTVAYFKVTDHWLNTLGDLVVEEQYESAPYNVKLDTSSLQLVDLPLEVRVLNDKQYELVAQGENVVRYNLSNNTVVESLPEVNFTKVLDFGKPYKDKYMSFTLERSNLGDIAPGKKYFFVINSLGSLVGQYKSTLQVTPIERESRMLLVTSKGSIPQKQISFLNTLLSEYVANDLAEKNRNGQKTLEFIDRQLATLTDSLNQSKQALSSFRSNKRISNVGMQSNLNFEKLSMLESEKAKLKTDRSYFATILEQVQNGNGIAQSVSPSVAGIQNPILSNLFLELSKLNQEKAGIQVNATVNNPKLVKLESEITSTRNAIEANIKNLIRSADTSISDVDQRISNLEAAIAEMPENERRLTDLQSQSDFIGKKYDFLLEKRAEAAISLATNTTDKKIVDHASMAGNAPVNTKPKMIYLLALMIGLAVPAGLIVLMSNVDNTIQGKDDLSKVTNIPFLGVVAHGTKSDKLAVLNNPRSAIAESFRSLRINLQYLMADKGFKVIGVTSSISGEGKTFCSVNLSSELAMSGKRVLLIESDLRKPTFGKYFNVKGAMGISSYLSEDLPLDEVIHKTEIDGLDVIPCGPIPGSAIQLLERPKMKALIQQLKDFYDYVVIDTPPIGYVSEYFVLMQHMDVNLYVVKHKYTEKNLLNQVNELYADKRVKNMYMIINDLNYSKTYEYGYKKKGNYYYA